MRDAIDVFGRRGETLIVDLTALTTCAEEVAHAVLDSAESLASCRVTVLRKHGTEVDQLLSAPRSER